MNIYKILAVFLFLFFASFSFSQSIPGTWRDYISFRQALQIHAVEKDVFVMSYSGFWMYSIENQEIRRFSKVHGLSGVNLTASTYHPDYKKIIIGYANGGIDIIDYPSFSVASVRDIALKPILGSKAVRKIEYLDSLLFIATDFGLVVYDVSKHIFLTTTILGTSGNTIPVTDVIIHENSDSISIATSTAIYSIARSLNIADFSLWTMRVSQSSSVRNIGGITSFNNQLVYIEQDTARNLDSVYILSNNSITPLSFQPGYVESVFVHNNTLVIHSRYSVAVFDTDFNELYSYAVQPEDVSNWFRDIAFDYTNTIWYAGHNNGIARLGQTNMMQPNSIYSNLIANLYVDNNTLYCVQGRKEAWQIGFFNMLVNGVWYGHINWEVQNTTSVYALPNSKNYYYATDGFGLVKGTVSWKYDTIYNSLNSPIQKRPSYDREHVTSISSDANNTLWITNEFSETPLLAKTQNGDWYSYTFPSNVSFDIVNLQVMVCSQGHKWISGLWKYILVFTHNNTFETTQDDQFVVIPLEDAEGVIAQFSTCIVEDNNGAVWIGTSSGIAVHNAPKRVFNDRKSISRIKIEMDNEVGYLLGSESITAIAVDAGNRKWIGTQNSGVFLFSADGAEQLAHYTIDNSPLPSNFITSIAIIQETGEVFFGTESGLVSLLSDSRKGAQDQLNLSVVPNPVRSSYDGNVYIHGTPTNAIFKISTLSGRLVYEGQAFGGTAVWDGTNLYGDRVQTGIYLVYVTSEDGSQTGVTKLMMIH